MSKQLEKEFMNDVMDNIELKVEPTDIAKLLYDIYDVPSGVCEQVKDMVQRLEAKDNVEPSKALKSLEVLDKTISPLLAPILAKYEDDLNNKITANYFLLKQALLEAQENETDIIHYKGTVANLRRDNTLLKELNAEYKEVLKLVFDRKVDIYHLSKSKTAEDYNGIWENSTYCLTDEEFDLLKRWQNGKRI